MSACQPARASRVAANRPLMEPPMITARRSPDLAKVAIPTCDPHVCERAKLANIAATRTGSRRNAMALTTLDKTPVQSARTPWPPEIAAEFERERASPNGCVGQRLVSESDRV